MQILMVLQYILKQFCMLQNSPLPAVYGASMNIWIFIGMVWT